MEQVLERIYKSSLKFLVPLSLGETYATIVKEAIKLVDANYGTLFLGEDGVLHRVYSTSPIISRVKTRKRGFTYQAFKKQKAFVKLISAFSRYHPELAHFGIKSNIFIPLSYKNVSIGVLIINSTKQEVFTVRALNIIKLFGSMASLAIRKNQLQEETKKALETRDIFISMAAHELRTPLTTINGYVQLLKNKIMDSESAEARWIEELSWETYRLTYLVNELLEVNRIKSGIFSFNLRECNLKDIITRALGYFQFSYPNRRIVLVDQLKNNSDFIVADFDKILQTLTNLLDNAAKFSPPDKEILLIIKSKKPCFIIQVKDQGHGISQADLPKIFDGFYRGSNHQKEGMGLGLFLAKNIIRRHHGSIDIYTKARKGTMVEIKLPKATI